jgi:hypothetical protein
MISYYIFLPYLYCVVSIYNINISVASNLKCDVSRLPPNIYHAVGSGSTHFSVFAILIYSPDAVIVEVL